MTYVRGLLVAVRIFPVAAIGIPKMIQAHRSRCAIECVGPLPPAVVIVFAPVTLALASLFV